MKIVALIRDGHGCLHLAATRAQELVRRELADRTGTAVLLWCGVPPHGTAGAGIVSTALERMNCSSAADLSGTSETRIITVLMDLCHHEPRRAFRRRQIRRKVMNLVRSVSLWFKR